MRDLVYEIGCKGSGLKVVVEKGRLTDLGSTPKLLRGIFPPDGPWAAATAVHDVLYEDQPVSRLMADLIFFEAMGVPVKALGRAVPRAQRYVAFMAVRVGGRSAWQRGASSPT